MNFETHSWIYCQINHKLSIEHATSFHEKFPLSHTNNLLFKDHDTSQGKFMSFSSFQPVKKVLDLKLFFLRIFVRELKNKISRSLNLWVHNGKSIFQASLLPGCLQLVINKWQVIPCMQESVCVDLQLIPWDIPHKKKTGFKFWFWILDKKKEEKEKRKKME